MDICRIRSLSKAELSPSILSRLKREISDVNAGKDIVRDLKDLNMGTPEFQSMFKKFASRFF
jgi:hypothetical protein